jgi:hypothetical protein
MAKRLARKDEGPMSSSEDQKSDRGESVTMNKPFHLMTPAERTAARIAQNRAISEKIAESKTQRPPVRSSAEYIRATPEERAELGSVIRKVRS